MFERFTDRSRKVMALANQEAQRFNHEYIGTEHILLGMIKEGSGIGATILKNLHVDLQSEVERLLKRGPDRVTMGKLPQTQGARKVIEYAIEETREMEQQLNRRLDVGTEHILLGLLREHEGLAAQVLLSLGLQIEQVRGEVLRLEGEKEPLMEREPITLEDKGEKKPLIKRRGLNMFQRFTDRARKVMALANQEAQRFNHEYIGTEHILLGLVKEGSGVGAAVLKNLEVDIKKLRLEVDRLVKSGPDMVTMGKLPQTPRAKQVIKYAIEGAESLNHNYVGTEHILLGLLRESEGKAAQILINLGLKLEDVRQEVLNLIGAGVDDGPAVGMKMSPTVGRKPKSKTPALDSFEKGKVSMNQDEQYLKLLSVFHYVVGGLVAFFACIFLFHLCIGVAMLTGAIDDAPAFVGLMFVVMATVAITLGWTLAVCIIIAGRCLAKRTRYMFCLVMAAISCIFMPFGTVLGVFTIIVLMRPSVKELFAANKAL